jgi:hypothetical protein
MVPGKLGCHSPLLTGDQRRGSAVALAAPQPHCIRSENPWRGRTYAAATALAGATFLFTFYTKPHNLFINVLWGSNYQTLAKRTLGTFFFPVRNPQREF